MTAPPPDRRATCPTAPAGGPSHGRAPRRVAPPLAALLLGVAATVGGLCACDGSPRYEGGADDWTLYRTLSQADEVEVVVPTEDFAQQLTTRWQRLAPELAARTRIRTLGEEAGHGGLRILIGTPADPVPTQLVRRLGVQVLEGQGFRAFERDFLDPGDALRAVIEDPRRPGTPLTLWFGNDLTRLWSYLDDLRPRWRPHLDVFDRGDLAFSYPLSNDAIVLHEQGIDHLARREAAAEDAAATQYGGVRLWLNEPPNALQLQDYLRAMVTARVQALRALDAGPTPRNPGPVVEVYLSSRPEELTAILGEPALSKVNPVRRSVDALFGRGLPDDRGAGVAQAAALAAAGEPAYPWMLDGLGVAASGAWWNRPLDEVVGHIVASKTAPSLDDLIDPASDALLSPHVLGPLRAQLMLFLLETQGPTGLRALWRGVRELKVDGPTRTRWREALQSVVAKSTRARRQRDQERRVRTRDVVLGRFHGGVAVPDVHGPDGSAYLGEAVVERLEQAVALGAETFSIQVRVPLYAGPLKADGVLAGVASASASDLALVSVLTRGRALGLVPVLVVEPLSADSGPRADQAALASVSDWEGFFARLLPVVQHYGLLAELAGVDVLCLGRELSLALRTQEAESGMLEDEEVGRELLEVRARGWTALTHVARSVYRGALTTCARWPLEAEQMSRWDRFDAVAVEVWPRFDERAGIAPDLERATRSYVSMLQRYYAVAREAGKPLLVLQAGFPARSDSWGASWLPRGEPDPAAQVLAYRALRQAVERVLRDSMPLAGLHVWTWPAAADGVRGYAPASDEALEVLAELFALEE